LIQISQKGKKILLLKRFSAGEMDAGLSIPSPDRAQEVVGDFEKT
jgi:hypothetical protein